MATAAATAGLRQHPSFVFYWLSRVASTLSFQMQAVAIGWQVYDMTDRPLALGLVALAQFMPSLLLALPVGYLADRFDRPRIVRCGQMVEGVALLALALGILTGNLGLIGLFVAAITLATGRAFEGPTLQALLPGLVPPQLIPRAVASSASANQSAVIVGPALGGLLYPLGPEVVYLVAGALVLFAAIGMLRVRALQRQAAARDPASLRSLLGGIGFIARHKAVLGAISLDLFAVLLGGVVALLPIYARDILMIGPEGLGVLRSGPAVGALAMSIALTRMPPMRHAGRVMFAGVAVFGVATIVFALSTSFALTLAALIVLGAGDNISVVIRMSLVQLETPDDMRGRVSAVNSVFISSSNRLGDFRAGVTAEWMGAVGAALLGGIGSLLVVLAWMRWFPELYRVERLEPPR
jgi:MFS family permease